MTNTDWQLFKGNGEPNEQWELPPPPSWRPFGHKNRSEESRHQRRAETFQAKPEVINMINAALYLRRPLLITGKPGTGKSSLAYAVARELVLGEVLYWPITTRTTLQNGLYDYDAIGRLQDAKPTADLGSTLSPESDLENIGKYITLGPLGTALMPSEKPRILLIDEIDKSDIDLPNDLLTVLEEGRFEIRELSRIKEKAPRITVRTAYTDASTALPWQPQAYKIENGSITCNTFPLVILTSNGERAFPPPFLRRCLRLHMQVPKGKELERIVDAHLEHDLQQRKQQLEQQHDVATAQAWYEQAQEERKQLIKDFEDKCKTGDIATDQLLNAIFMVTRERTPIGDDKEQLIKTLMKHLTSGEDT
jgi:MoxR-like ATPase